MSIPNLFLTKHHRAQALFVQNLALEQRCIQPIETAQKLFMAGFGKGLLRQWHQYRRLDPARAQLALHIGLNLLVTDAAVWMLGVLLAAHGVTERVRVTLWSQSFACIAQAPNVCVRGCYTLQTEMVASGP